MAYAYNKEDWEKILNGGNFSRPCKGQDYRGVLQEVWRERNIFERRYRMHVAVHYDPAQDAIMVRFNGFFKAGAGS